MKSIILNHEVIPVKIIRKKNKHTYFYFNEPGLIKVHLAKRHTIQFVKDFFQKNENKMYQKYIANNKRSNYSSELIYHFGITYEVALKEQSNVQIDSEKNEIIIPNHQIDHINKIVLNLQKDWMKNNVAQLIKKYQDNPYIDINDIQYRYSFMKSRYGSCNAKKRKIHLNLHLLKLDPLYTEYIFLHEITHLNIQNHSSDFYRLLMKLCPNYKDLRKSLRKKKLW